jgi:hypothetical protein
MGICAAFVPNLMYLFQCQPGWGSTTPSSSPWALNEHVRHNDGQPWVSTLQGVRIVVYSTLILIALIPLARARSGRAQPLCNTAVCRAHVPNRDLHVGRPVCLHFPEAYIPWKFDRFGSYRSARLAVAFVMQHLNSSALWMWGRLMAAKHLIDMPRDLKTSYS